jgi:hypothetical protein
MVRFVDNDQVVFPFARWSRGSHRWEPLPRRRTMVKATELLEAHKVGLDVGCNESVLPHPSERGGGDDERRLILARDCCRNESLAHSDFVAQ